MKQLSIKDIAKIAGVVPSTVSFVINGKEREMRISEEKARQIRKIIKETGYIPNRSAASLRTGRTHVIGLIVEDISNNFFSLLAKAIEDIAYEVGYRVVYCSTEDDDKKGSEQIRMLHKQVDGFIITPSSGMKDEVFKLQNAGKPVVLLDRYFQNIETPCVMVDNKNSILDGVELLLKKGYKNVAFVVTALDQMQMKERLDAFVGGIKKYKKYQEKLILKLPFSIEDDAYYTGLKRFLQKNKEIDAIFFATNYLAIAGLKVLKELQWKIPEKVAVLSFDDHPVFAMYDPEITAINQPIADIARSGVELLAAQMNGNLVEKQKPHVLHKAILQIRESV